MHPHKLSALAAFVVPSSAAPADGPAAAKAVVTGNIEARTVTWIKPTYHASYGFCGFPGFSCWGKYVNKDDDGADNPPVPIIIDNSGSTHIPVVPSTIASFGWGPTGVTRGPPVTLTQVTAAAETTSEIRITVSDAAEETNSEIRITVPPTPSTEVGTGVQETSASEIRITVSDKSDTTCTEEDATVTPAPTTLATVVSKNGVHA